VRGKQKDIQGLRAVAVGLVVLYHLWPQRLSGGFIGVDVFFVISGFLITSQLLRMLERDGTFSLREFYARRIKRLLPASFLVLLVTLLVAVAFTPRLLHLDIGWDGLATSLYASNYWLAFTGTDYLSSDTPSLFQHYWSLAVEEQFYLCWPLLLLLLGRRGGNRRRRLGWALALIAASSFAACAALTAYSQPWAFFSLHTRAWELAIGALVAVAAPRLLQMTSKLSNSVALAGVAGILVCGITFNEQLAFPGWVAILPVLSTALVLVGGLGNQQTWADRALGLKPMQYLGDRSYSIYLWHWPILVMPPLITGDWLPWWAKIGLLSVTLIAADLTFRFVENPLRLATPRRRLPIFAAAAALTVVSVLVSVSTVTNSSIDLTSRNTALGATLTVPAFVPGNLTPSFDAAKGDLPAVYADGCHAGLYDKESDDCTYGPATSDLKVVLFGDSHAAQWFPALLQEVSERGGEILSLTKSACPSARVSVFNSGIERAYVECDAWRANAIERISSYQPNLVVLSNYGKAYEDLLLDGQAFLPTWDAGLRNTITELPATSRVMVLSDTPAWDVDPSVCLSDNLDTPADCGKPIDDLTDSAVLDTERAAIADRGIYVETTDLLCVDACYGVAGQYLIYRDTNHVTASYAKRLGAALWTRVQGGMPAM
jgi:peptidoglycan/LPS O-acetylase OafA/YrhL